MNAVLPTTLGKKGLGKIVLKYFGPTGLPSGVPARLAASFTPPKNASDVKMRMTYSLKPSENPWYRASVPFGIQRLQPRSGVAFGSVNTTVKFGQSKSVNLPIKSLAQKVVASAVTARALSRRSGPTTSRARCGACASESQRAGRRQRRGERRDSAGGASPARVVLDQLLSCFLTGVPFRGQSSEPRFESP